MFSTFAQVLCLSGVEKYISFLVLQLENHNDLLNKIPMLCFYPAKHMEDETR